MNLEFQAMMKAYAAHYYQGHNMDTKNFNGYSLLDEDFASGTAHQFGAKTITSDARFFFEEIRIHNKDTAQGGRTTVLFNCMINTVQHSTFDYSQSSSSTYNVSFQAEHVNIEALNTELVNETQAQRQSLQSTTASTVANRPTTSSVQESGLRPFEGILRTGESLRNIDGTTFVVPANSPDSVAGSNAQ